jgi:hypothetical protein
MPETLRYAVYIGYGVGGDSFSGNEMPANRVNEAKVGRNEVKLEERCSEAKRPRQLKSIKVQEGET